MEGFLIAFQIILSILIILIVLVNVTKGSEYGAVFRGAETIFGGEGPTNFLNKVIMGLSALFFLNSLFLTKLITSKNKITPVVAPPAKVKPKKSIPVPESLPEKIPVPPKAPASPSSPKKPGVKASVESKNTNQK